MKIDDKYFILDLTLQMDSNCQCYQLEAHQIQKYYLYPSCCFLCCSCLLLQKAVEFLVKL